MLLFLRVELARSTIYIRSLIESWEIVRHIIPGMCYICIALFKAFLKTTVKFCWLSFHTPLLWNDRPNHNPILCIVLQEARARFRQTLSDSSSRLNVLLKKHKRSIEKSREYYQTLANAKKVKQLKQ